ncbi:MAG: hypothetical protein ACI8WY_002957, partial [Planctomycetota bacterium]
MLVTALSLLLGATLLSPTLAAATLAAPTLAPMTAPVPVKAQDSSLRCEGDTVPPGANNKIPEQKKFGGPSTPGTVGEPGQQGPNVGPDASLLPPPPSTPIGPSIATYDPLHWSYWWRLERDGFLDLRQQVRFRHEVGPIGVSAVVRTDLPPSRAVVDSTVVPALLKILGNERSDDMIKAALVAVARIGDGRSAGAAGVASQEIQDAIVLQLASSSQEISETAALALGIFGEGGSFALIDELLKGTQVGAALVGRGQVPSRTQAFAAFGLGVLAYDAPDVGQRQRAAVALLETVSQPHSGPDVPVAAMLALGQCRLPARPTLPPRELRGHVFAEAVMSNSGMALWLLDRLNGTGADAGAQSPKERAFSMVALSHFAATSGGALRAEILDRLCAEARSRRQASEVRSAAVVAIGELATSGSTDADRAALQFLVKLIESSQPLERRLGTMALAQASARAGPGDHPLGGVESAAGTLQRVFLRGGSSERPWGALALGVQAYYLSKAAGLSKGPGNAITPSAKLLFQRAQLRKGLAKQKNVATIGAYALGLALAHEGAAATDKMQAGEALLDAYARTAEGGARGHVALALGMLGYEPAKDSLFEGLTEALSRPSLLWHTAVGLGLVGDDRLTPRLIEALIAA